MDFVKNSAYKPYILFITSNQEFMLREYIKQMQWHISIFLCVPVYKREPLQNLLQAELKGKNDFQTEPSKKTYIVNDMVFTEVSLGDEVSKVCCELGMNKTVRRKTASCKKTDSGDKHVHVVETESVASSPSNEGKGRLPNLSADLDLEKLKLLTLWKDTHLEITDENDRHLSSPQGNINSSCSDARNENENNRSSESFKSGDGQTEDCYGPVPIDKVVAYKANTISNLEERTELDGSDLVEVCSNESDVNDDNVEIDHDINEVDKTTKNKSITVSNRTIYGTIKKRQHRKKKSNGKLKSLFERLSSLKCNICGKAFASENFYKRHLGHQHSDEAVAKRAVKKRKKEEESGVHVCTLCQKQFSDKYGLQAHLKNMHSDNLSSYQCDLCGAVVKFKGSLVQHMKSVHTDQRPYQCSICNKQFKVLHQLKNHQQRHNPDHVETCTMCGKTVKKGQLSCHLKRHGDNRKHACRTCGKTFFEKQDLERHLRIHSGEKPYKCPICPYACAIKGNMTKHIIHKHRKGPYNPECDSPVQPYYGNDVKRSSKDIHPANIQVPLYYVTKRTSGDADFNPDKGTCATEHTNHNRLVHLQHVDGKRNINPTSYPHHSLYSESNLSKDTHQPLPVYLTKSNEVPADRSKPDEGVSTEPCGIPLVYHEGNSVYYNMRPVVRLNQTDDHMMTPLSATSHINGGHHQTDDQMVTTSLVNGVDFHVNAGHVSADREHVSGQCGMRSSPDPRYTYGAQS